MSVKHIMTIDNINTNTNTIELKQFAIMGNTYCPQGEVYELKENDKILIKNPCLENKSLKWISMISSMCNESKLTYNIVNNNIHWHITGEPTEGALKVLSEKLHPPDDNNNNIILHIYII